jgi:hypothetical protein
MEFTKDNLDDIRKELNDVLQRYGVTKDVEFQIGNITFEDNSFRTTLKAFNVEGGIDAAQVEFEKWCYKFGVQKSWYGKDITFKGKQYRIAGIKPRARKFPVILFSYDTGKKDTAVTVDSIRGLV